MQASLEAYLASSAVEAGLAPHSLHAYRRDLESAALFFGSIGLQTWAEIRPEDLTGYLAHRRQQGAAPASQVRLLSSFRGLFRWLRAEEGFESKDPTRFAGRVHLWQRLPEILQVEEAQRLLDQPSTETWIGLRDRALLALLYGAGLRVSEATGLRLDGLSLRAFVGDPDPGVLQVRGKGEKERLVPFGGLARERLEHWLEQGRPSRPANPPQVLLTKTGRAMDRHLAFRIVRQHAVAAGLPADLHPHMLRHSCATHLLLGGGDLRSVQEFLGHADLRTTERYTHLEVDQLQAFHRLHHPRG